jgi:hypothetical protein
MPNWCDNELTITLVHQDQPHRSMSVIEAFREVHPLMKVHPAPNREWDWQWCVDNWNTKWDIEPDVLDYYTENGMTYLRICFSSAWSPPIGVYRHLSEEHPDLQLEWLYCLLMPPLKLN